MTVSPAGRADRPRPRLEPASIASVAVGGILLCTWFWVSLSLLITGLGGLPALGSGLLLLIPWLLMMQVVVRIERRRAVAIHGLRVILPAQRRSRRQGTSGWLQDRWYELGSGAFWRGVLHHHLAILVTGLFFLASVALLWAGWTIAETAIATGPVQIGTREISRIALAVFSSASVLLAAAMLALGALADRGLARGLISGSEDDLREQVAELAERRQGAVDAAAQERLRIERDLHDGVQPRLVNLAMTLGIARGAIRADPERAERLVGEAHAEAKAVMTDLRQLARGIHPAVLTDRGLDAALSALAARSQIPVALDVDLGGPAAPALDREREAVAYFVVAEALTNIAKHAAATRAEVTVTRDEDSLQVRIRDDGRGGARVHRDGLSTGLAGLTDRVRATGGALEVVSSAGEGTALRADIPLTSSPTPRTLPRTTTEETSR
ncbi:sensor histidine kinase [Brachybacterium ginsengisoli]|uniref:histidine kinase n=1 Tax=Brachybacterium ginsengisoli TaxID=1331682 RepID=A0A291GY43_9MICO|nr:histidine kinase [Brachybacterium ginsengisoli]ATG55151.1 sensor histidine kinase [Brachybacterium ginsengisoli]